MAKFLGIDIGTSGCRALVVDERGRALESSSAEYPISTPKAGWSEQNPEDWWNGVQSCLSQLSDLRVDAIGLSGQMHGSVFLDERGEVIRPAILWNDQRTTKECAQIDQAVGPERVRAITGNPPLTGFQLPKVLWLRNHEREQFDKTRHILLPKDYIRYRLTGELATEVSDGSGTGLLDVGTRNWSPEIALALSLNLDLFPECFESDNASTNTSNLSNLRDGIPVVGGGGDQAAGAVGTGAVEPGIVSVSLGTSGVVFTALDLPQFDPKGAVHTFCHANRAWHAMGVMLSCGGSLKWFRDNFGNGLDYNALGSLASKADAGSAGLTFLPYLTGERSPHNDPFARGSWSGIDIRQSMSEFARSIFEGATFGLLECYEALEKLGGYKTHVRVTGGGARNPFWVQMIADAFQCTCQILENDEGPAFGAALLAGVGVGHWSDVQSACRVTVRIKEEVEPSGVDYSVASKRYRELYRVLQNWQVS
jgi:xylulokinase